MDPASGLMDEEGCLWKSARLAMAKVPPDAAKQEFRAQIQRALDGGIDVTHIDLHNSIERKPEFLEACHELGKEFKLPAFCYRDPIFTDVIVDMRINRNAPTDWFIQRLKAVRPGFTFIHSHAAKGGEELAACTGARSAGWRDASYRALVDPRLKEAVEEMGLKLVGYREIRDVMGAHPDEFWG